MYSKSSKREREELIQNQARDRERRTYSKSSNMSSGIDRVHAYMWRARGRDGGRVRRQMYILCENSCVIQSSCGVFTEISPPIDDVYDAMPLQLLCEEISHLTHTPTHTLTHTYNDSCRSSSHCMCHDGPERPTKGERSASFIPFTPSSSSS